VIADVQADHFIDAATVYNRADAIAAAQEAQYNNDMDDSVSSDEDSSDSDWSDDDLSRSYDSDSDDDSESHSDIGDERGDKQRKKRQRQSLNVFESAQYQPSTKPIVRLHRRLRVIKFACPIPSCTFCNVQYRAMVSHLNKAHDTLTPFQRRSILQHYSLSFFQQLKAKNGSHFTNTHVTEPYLIASLAAGVVAQEIFTGIPSEAHTMTQFLQQIMNVAPDRQPINAAAGPVEVQQAHDHHGNAAAHTDSCPESEPTKFCSEPSWAQLPHCTLLFFRKTIRKPTMLTRLTFSGS
jgi:hypothetical protein